MDARTGRARFTEEFFRKNYAVSSKGAKAVVPILMKELVGDPYLRWRVPNNVLDVGCGAGAWSDAFEAYGAEVVRIDGEWAQPKPDYVCDLSSEKPFDFAREFDLALCIEVAEHLNEEAGLNLVKTIAVHAKSVLWSAAVPHQGGTGHVNEQWPEYWAAVWAKYGFGAADVIRPKIYGRPEVPWYFQQNMILYTRGGMRLAGRCMDYAHPKLVEVIVRRGQRG